METILIVYIAHLVLIWSFHHKYVPHVLSITALIAMELIPQTLVLFVILVFILPNKGNVINVQKDVESAKITLIAKLALMDICFKMESVSHALLTALAAIPQHASYVLKDFSLFLNLQLHLNARIVQQGVWVVLLKIFVFIVYLVTFYSLLPHYSLPYNFVLLALNHVLFVQIVLLVWYVNKDSF